MGKMAGRRKVALRHKVGAKNMMDGRSSDTHVGRLSLLFSVFTITVQLLA